MGGKILYVKDVTRSLGFRAMGEKMGISYAYRMLQDNCKDLAKVLTEVEEHPISTLDPEIRRRLGKNGFDLEGKFEFLYEVTSPTIKALTNYVASISALKDALYKLDSFIATNKGRSNVRSMMTNKFADNPEAAFLLDLRDNCLHGHGTQPSLMMEDNNVDGKWVPSNYFYVDKSILNKGDWCARSKEYINSWPGKMRVTDIVDAYQKEIDDFFESVLNYYDGVFKTDFEETKRLEDEFFKSRQIQ